MAAVRHFQRFVFSRSLIYEDTYVWLVLFAVLEAALTWGIFTRGGMTLGLFNQTFIQTAGLRALTVYEMTLAVLFVVICEEIGRRRLVTGRMVANMVASVWGAAVLILLMQFCMTF